MPCAFSSLHFHVHACTSFPIVPETLNRIPGLHALARVSGALVPIANDRHLDACVCETRDLSSALGSIAQARARSRAFWAFADVRTYVHSLTQPSHFR